MTHDPTLERALAAHHGQLFAVCYRLTGSAADAEELAQETCLRALRSPPADTQRALSPWLVRVATHLALDRLRKRKRERYLGTWLPEPWMSEGPALEEGEPEGRYARAESLGYAFLCALEVLPPRGRAALILRDVLDLSLGEIASLLETSEGNAKVLLHRARRALKDYDARREELRPSPALDASKQAAMQGFLAALVAGDEQALAHCLHHEVTMLNDGGGEFFAARKPVVGRARVLTFQRKTMAHGMPRSVKPVVVNGETALYLEYDERPPGFPTRALVRVDLDGEGRIVMIHNVVATEKLRSVALALRVGGSAGA
jgi:RNA polymerase sigma-70 factor (ECF subfamily)